MSQADISIDYGDKELKIFLSGKWSIYKSKPDVSVIDDTLKRRPEIRTVVFSCDNLDWDTSLLTYLTGIYRLQEKYPVAINSSGLPEGAKRLMNLAAAVPPRQTGRRRTGKTSVLTGIGNAILSLYKDIPGLLIFLGEIMLSVGRFVRGKAQYRRTDVFLIIEEVGPRAFPIVSLISFLVGLILAYMGAIQLAQFGAQIYIADLVAIGMVREMAALMTGIILAGRTGAAFAAQLGTMQVNEEIDAFKALAISPMDFLVLPRLLALLSMVPLLTFYASMVGLLAGLIVAVVVFDIGVLEYYFQTVSALHLKQFAVGIFKGTVYGALVAFAGCYHGMRCGRSAQAVGQATTAAVVSGILYIVIAASLLTILFQKLGI